MPQQLLERPTYISTIEPYINAPLVKILTGIRRCGKSTLLRQIAELLVQRDVPQANILRYSFDSMQYAGWDASQLYQHLSSALSIEESEQDRRFYLFLDEVQEIDGWERVVNSLMTERNVDIYVTGSNSRMMSSEISTYLTGRYVAFRVFPLSFAEYLRFMAAYDTDDDNRNTHYQLGRYIQHGGFPATCLTSYTDDQVYAIVKDIYNSTIFTDIVRRNNIRKVDQLERIVRYTFDNVGRTFSAATIAKYLKNQNRSIDSETVYSYLKQLESAYILHRCSRYDLEGKEILKTQEKFYLADSSLRYAVLGYHPDSVAAMLENLVYLELLRRGWQPFVGKIGEAEVDFVAKKQHRTMYIQIAQTLSNPDTRKREYSRLLSLHDNYPKYVLCTDEYTAGDYQGITTMHVADFLLSERW
ncbi:ATPase [Bifidobacterium saguini DSM 23967]|uniref:ATPase n=2 Tax=Bifidobacterium saguini TaxID=762210 RepID=A0A087DC46_9BIFI|nr:ATP-binding protein [Bifidobacterium saguini]KFI93096.1 ATPase [Bifidobacterium saguini DSM 23967]QTB91281.1 ATP-binding protein [Bifidobacterium saguini]